MAKITARIRDRIMELNGEGKTTREIAAQLGTEGLVVSHVSVSRCLARAATAAAAQAVTAGVAAIPDPSDRLNEVRELLAIAAAGVRAGGRPGAYAALVRLEQELKADAPPSTNETAEQAAEFDSRIRRMVQDFAQ